MRIRTFALMLSAVLCAGARPAYAQDSTPFRQDDASAASSDSGLLDDIVVTANKRAQNLQDVGISVSAFSGDQLNKLGLAGTQGLGSQVPGLLVTDLGSPATTENGGAIFDHGSGGIVLLRAA
ncbi:hypothetical protein [Novosphingobium barchaimii]|nr:hypothetical protein [Novosphingobium barchaimii]